uniref:Uncharacterized protein TCIL3000_6_1670 n=1 Tax=Trypanosoma congolense (strain IL3000) TaxID=1068625 RepID=G0UNH2_TRYCI|nr:unnamed protein product [Trypanosoma congolense IL3000]
MHEGEDFPSLCRTALILLFKAYCQGEYIYRSIKLNILSVSFLPFYESSECDTFSFTTSFFFPFPFSSEFPTVNTLSLSCLLFFFHFLHQFYWYEFNRARQIVYICTAVRVFGCSLLFSCKRPFQWIFFLEISSFFFSQPIDGFRSHTDDQFQ